MNEIVEMLEDPSTIEDPEKKELMETAEMYVTEAYTAENGEVNQDFLDLAEETLEQYAWVDGLEKESGKYEF